MKNINIQIHKPNLISIMDLQGKLDISDFKWKEIFAHFSDSTSAVYFYGLWADYVDEEVVKNIHFVAEEVLFQEQGYEYVLFSIKYANLSLSMNLLSKIWEVYEAPSLIFSSRKEDLGLIKATLMDRFQYDNLFRCVKGLVMFFQKHEDNVLWIAADDDLTVFTETLFEKP